MADTKTEVTAEQLKKAAKAAAKLARKPPDADKRDDDENDENDENDEKEKSMKKAGAPQASPLMEGPCPECDKPGYVQGEPCKECSYREEPAEVPKKSKQGEGTAGGGNAPKTKGHENYAGGGRQKGGADADASPLDNPDVQNAVEVSPFLKAISDHTVGALAAHGETLAGIAKSFDAVRETNARLADVVVGLTDVLEKAEAAIAALDDRLTKVESEPATRKSALAGSGSGSFRKSGAPAALPAGAERFTNADGTLNKSALLDAMQPLVEAGKIAAYDVVRVNTGALPSAQALDALGIKFTR